MAAIAGVLRLDGNPGVIRETQGLMARMAHRAPNGAHVFGEGCIALAHGALHATPESVHEHQPLRFGERWVLVVDGRIDDRASLVRHLDIDQGLARGLGDADLFAEAWLRWGREFWRHVTGDYALAAWDRRERNLVVMRDPIGVRPVFYARTSRLLAFASEPEALLGVEGISRTCEPDGLASMMVAGFQKEDISSTLYRDVSRLLPGESLEVAEGAQERVRRYRQMAPGPVLRLEDPREYVDAFKAVFSEAVECRMRAPTRPALMLSGGIDSASIFAAAGSPGSSCHGADGGLLTVSVVADEGRSDGETANILRMDSSPASVLLPVPSFSGCVTLEELGAEAWNQAHPIDNALLLPRLVYMAARKAGSAVVLDGIDGDLVMRSSDHYAGAMALAGHPVRAWREARQASRNNTYLRGESALRILANGIVGGIEPLWLSTLRYRRQDRREGDSALGGVIDREFARRLRLRERMLALAIEERQRRMRSSHAEDLVHVWQNPGFMRGMEGYDRTAANFGIEARHPWCDQRVVEFFLGLPVEYKVRGGWIKWIARAAFEDTLGAPVAWHFGKDHLGYRVSLEVLDATASRVHGLLGEARSRLQGLVDDAVLTRLLSAWPRGPISMSDDDRGMAIEIATLVAWMNRFDLQCA